ncbi:MAG: sensor histidine kinase [Spirochaetales bacterium]|nr:sensor histidine kinase [Spirochaetales bacterium]
MLEKISHFLESKDFLIKKKRLHFIAIVFLSVLSITLLILLVEQASAYNYISVAVLAALAVSTILCFLLIKKGKIQAAFLFLSLILLAGITLIITNGQGIHDVSIIGIPAILIIGSIFSGRRFFFILSCLIVLSLGWIVFGDMFGFYTPASHGKGDTGDFIIVSSIIIFTALTVFIITNSQNIAFNQARIELHNRRKLAKSLGKSLQEKEILLKEIHHRVKNNLSVIISLLNIQGQSLENETHDILQKSINRIYSIALVHEMLYGKREKSEISMKEYVNDITSHILNSIQPHRNIAVNNMIEDLTLSLESAVPCGIILNELISNSICHAVTGDQIPEIGISMSENESAEIRLTICDNGNGFNEKLKKSDWKTTGLHLIDSLSDQLGGRIERSNSNGSCFVLTFPRHGRINNLA